MTHSNLDIIDRFFEAYGQRDFGRIRQVMAENATWTFPGRHSISGTKTGLEEVVAFFDTMGNIMGQSNVQAERLIVGVNDGYVVECQHMWTNRADGPNLDHQWCVLWEIKDGKIIAGRHFAADQHAVDAFFDKVTIR